MSKERFCPECGQPVNADERFCPDCGAEVPFEPTNNTGIPEGPLNKVKPSETSEPIIGAGARANITGGINKTSTTHANINTSSVDNSSTVHNNTTIVMEKEEAEYCEVCGNPFDERHARCPKCGKEIRLLHNVAMVYQSDLTHSCHSYVSLLPISPTVCLYCESHSP